MTIEVRGQIHTRCGPVRWGRPPALMGILNITPDSFSDGGEHIDPERAVVRGIAMAKAGASILDVGGVSTRPGSEAIDVKSELERVLPVVEMLSKEVDVPISVDTFRAEVFERAFAAGASMLNDVTAFGDDRMLAVLNETGAPAVVMHMQGHPTSMQVEPRYTDVVAEVKSMLSATARRALSAGIDPERLVLDPGIGFGKTVEHNLELLRRIDEFDDLGHPLLVGTSRKSFLGMILERSDPKEREYGSVATTAYLNAKGVAFLRVHDVEAHADVLRVLGAMESGAAGLKVNTWT